MKAVKEQGAKSVILDLRGNPGGLLEEAINVSNVFVPKGSLIVTTKGKLESWTKSYNALNEPVDIEIPVVVLIDNGSASASEIVAGVIQDYDRGVLVGRRTFGKGLVQQTRPLVYNSQLKVTTGKYYIPSGRCIQAIDYSKRDKKGSVEKIADSLKSEFTTSKGRVVFDGGGLKPDIKVNRKEYAPITYSLMRNHLIFQYATKYHHENDPVTDPRTFNIDETSYETFVGWLGDKEYNYTTKLEKRMNDLSKVAEEEPTYDLLQDRIVGLKSDIETSKAKDVYTYKTEIKALLEQEISTRKFLSRGMIESTFNKDMDILKAQELLENLTTFNDIIKK